MARDHGQRRERGREEEDTLTDAQVHVWTAWRGIARAAGQRLPGEDFTAAPPGAPHLTLPPACTHTHTMTSSEKHRAPGRSRRGVEFSGDREVNSRVRSSPGSPRRRGGRQNHLVEMEEGSEESNSPKVGATELAGVGRDRQATAGRLGFAREDLGSERGGESEREPCGLGRFDQPRPRPCWASRLDGLAWPLGQNHVLFFFLFFYFL
jgi:hypothetical protein